MIDLPYLYILVAITLDLTRLTKETQNFITFYPLWKPFI